MDDDEKTLVIIMAYFYLRHIRPRLHKRKRENMSTISGHEFTLELLTGTTNQCFELLRMSRDTFVRLIAHFRGRRLLKDSKHISVEEKLAIFLSIIGGNQRYAVVKHRFQHSTQTINRVVNEVSDAMLKFAIEVIVPTSYDSSPEIPGANTRLRQIFKGAVGALDGILINAVIPADKQTLYKRRENAECCQNVMASCDFNMMFTYIVAGWEGIADDSQVLSSAIADTDARFPFLTPDKYYLCDTAYAHTRGFMTPYRNVRYSLRDFRDRRPMDKKEEFNHAHAKLRNVIERAFDVLKARFPILKKMISFPVIKQRDVTIACFAIHNFIRKESIDDELFAAYEREDMIFDNENEEEEDDDDDDDDEQDDEEYEDHDVVRVMDDVRNDQRFMVNLREEIAAQLMQDRE